MAGKKTRRPQSHGVCAFCGKDFAKAGMTKHLPMCEARIEAIEKADGTKSGKAETLFHMIVKDQYLPDYWIHFEIPAGQTLTQLDNFLRYIWVECCGHLSEFEIHGRSYSPAQKFIKTEFVP